MDVPETFDFQLLKLNIRINMVRHIEDSIWQYTIFGHKTMHKRYLLFRQTSSSNLKKYELFIQVISKNVLL